MGNPPYLTGPSLPQPLTCALPMALSLEDRLRRGQGHRELILHLLVLSDTEGLSGQSACAVTESEWSTRCLRITEPLAVHAGMLLALWCSEPARWPGSQSILRTRLLNESVMPAMSDGPYLIPVSSALPSLSYLLLGVPPRCPSSCSLLPTGCLHSSPPSCPSVVC